MRDFFNRHVVLLRAGVPLLAAAIFIFAFITFLNSQNQKQQASQSAQQAVANHTQTLEQLSNAVNTLKANNQVNHDTTIKYLQCIVQGLLTSTPQTAQATFSACLAVSGVKVGQ